jgi:hypothetical protein
MGSVSSVSPGIADLLQTLTNLNSPVMNSKSAVSALEKAPAADIVQLSVAASQLEGVDAMFGISSSSNTGASGILSALEGSTTSSTGTAAASVLSTASPADQAANAQAALQSEFTQGLFGTGINNSLSGTLFSTLA